MWFALHHVEHLSVPEESKQTLLKHILEYEIFVVITHLKNVTKNYVVNGCFPLSVLIGKVGEIVNLLLGDVSVNPIDLMDSLERIEKSFQHVHKAGAVPLSAGGDHLCTLPIFRAIAKDRPVGMVHFDAHSDTNDRYFGDNKKTAGKSRFISRASILILS